jgi:dipeptidyl aminopeptidase/acylaminoacyl peptidase
MRNFYKESMEKRFVSATGVMILLIQLLINSNLPAQSVLSPEELLKLKTCTDAKISPVGDWIAYTIQVPRTANDSPGKAYSELYVVSAETGEIKPMIPGKVSVKSPQWSSDGSQLAYLSKGVEETITQVWMIPCSGGEPRQITRATTSVLSFRLHPRKNQIVYIAASPKSEREKSLSEKGYEFIYYQENLKHRNLYIQDFTPAVDAIQLTKDITVWDFEFSSDGKFIAASVSEKNLIDHKYMFRKVYLLDLDTKNLNQLTDNRGKLGNYAFSPNGLKLVYAASLTRSDHQASQVYVINTKGGPAKNLTITDFRGHVNWVGWKDNQTVLYQSGEGVWSTLSKVNAEGGERHIILHSKKEGAIFKSLSFDNHGKKFAMVGSSPTIPGEVYFWKPGNEIKRLTQSNPWLEDLTLGAQKIINYKARDGLEIEGLLMYPVNYRAGQQYPLVVYIHGGPEHHNYNNWLSLYSRPGQVLAGKGYAVLYPNYRASTGYGVDFGMEGYGDPAGKEFDDIADGIEFLINEGIVDADRVGLAGGSYGGYASAWFATYYTKYVKAVCMFVGVSDLISRRGTTDIVYEELYVHSGKKLEEMWNLSLKRSPIYWAHQSKTAVLIYGGTDDTRVHPSQSLELYWRLRMNDHPAVRLVQYPGEKHGNAKQPGQIDVLYRQVQWLDWYVYNKKPLDGPLPPLDISDCYGLE